MTTQRATIIGVFSDREKARAAVNDLRRARFRDDQIGLVSRTDDKAGSATHAGGHQQFKEKQGVTTDPTQTHWEEGAEVGAAAGAATGTGLGLAVAAGLIPGLGPAIAGGTLLAILASAGTGAAVGGLVGSLVGLGVPEAEASYYATEFNTGRTIVTVRADERSADAWDVLARHGAYDFERQDTTAAAGSGLPATPY
jgi:hypothetical protein